MVFDYVLTLCRHETTSTALVWALWELSQHPEIQSRLRKEIHSILGTEFDPSKPPTNDQIDQMKYLNNVVREVLRVDPPGTLSSVPPLIRAPNPPCIFPCIFVWYCG
jgi:cytochrome P450